MPQTAMIATALVALMLALGAGSHQSASTDSNMAWSALAEDAIVLFRHAHAPGIGDPPDFKLGDCSTQRNLDNQGREQARRIGAAFENRNIKTALVLASQWCRAVETAELAFPGRVKQQAAFNSFFNARDLELPQTDEARRILLSWTGPGALVVVTHQVNITALVGIAPTSGEGIVIVPRGNKLTVVGRVRP